MLGRIERALGWAEGSVGVELMVETPRSLLAADGTVALPGLVSAAGGRCRAVHLGAWDLTAAMGVGAAHQTLLHPYCDAARALMVLSLAGTGVRVVDGATNVMPVEPHRGSELTAEQRAENRTAVVGALSVMTRHWLHSTRMGVHQGWDLHPGQVMWRHALVIAHARAAFPATARRLKAFIGQAAQAVRAGAVFDDAATGQGCWATCCARWTPGRSRRRRPRRPSGWRWDRCERARSRPSWGAEGGRPGVRSRRSVSASTGPSVAGWG
ncbi:MAG: hypothetical protein IPN17_18725 [Deltaproteobacteria bacterium]|nr:hypothetical protein [Deltaproteobacteria bacterium]